MIKTNVNVRGSTNGIRNKYSINYFYYFDTLTLGIIHQLFDCVSN